MNNINTERLTEIDELRAIIDLYEEAKGFIEGFNWCKKTINSWYDKDNSLYDKLGVFLFNIEPINDDVDDYIWIIVGDLPSVYLDKSIKNGRDALESYCELMQQWADRVKNEKSLIDCYPVEAEPTIDNAILLDKRISFIKQNILMTEKK